MTAPFEIHIASGVTEIGQPAWDDLAQARPFASYRWYEFGERVLADVKPVYIILSLGGEPVARATFWLARREALPLTARLARAVGDSVLRRWPLLICRLPLVDGPGLILPDPPLREEALNVLAQAAQEIGRQHRASFVIFDYLPRTEHRPAGFALSSFGEPSTQLDLCWSDMASYVGGLSKSARKDYHRHHNRAADLGIRVSAQPAVTRRSEALALIRQVEAHHQAAPNRHAEMMLEHADCVPATWLTAEIGDRLVGCGLLLGDGNGAQVLTLLGLDYGVRFVYFQLLYRAVQAAIEAGTRVLYGGSGANELKQRLGFALRDNNHLAVTSPKWMFRQVVRRFASHPSKLNRNT